MLRNDPHRRVVYTRVELVWEEHSQQRRFKAQWHNDQRTDVSVCADMLCST